MLVGRRTAGDVTPIYTITPLTSSGGTISPSAIQYVIAGENCTFNATPSSTMRVAQWFVNGIVVQNNGNSYTIYNVQSNMTIYATFEYYWDTTLKASMDQLWEFNGNLTSTVGSKTLIIDDGSAVTFSAGLMKNCIYFGQSNFPDLIDTLRNYNTASTPSGANWTFSVWVYLVNFIDLYANIFGRIKSPSQPLYPNWSGFMLQPGSGGKVNFAFFDYALSAPIVSDSLIPYNAWTHLCANYGGLYINGTKNKTLNRNWPSGVFSLDTLTTVGGLFFLQSPFCGYIEQMALWNRNLTDTEIAKLYNSGYGLKYD